MHQELDYVLPSGMNPPRGEYSHAVTMPIGDKRLCFITGQVGYDPTGKVAASLEAQMEQTFENIRTVLEAAGGSLGTVLQLTTYLTSQDDVPRYFAKRSKLFPTLFGTGYPANCLVVVSALARPGLLIEVQAIAATPAR
jgi:2-iminobutanoate/2-iminopropanoate deaminase